jgi:4a-hydroxytetrahydrobiopterin dehydratase
MRDRLSAEQVREALAGLDGWSGDTAELTRCVELASFRAAIQVVDRVAEVAEELDHHPDIDIRWRRLTFRLSTHSAGGVTELDSALAARINGIVSSVGWPRPA